MSQSTSRMRRRRCKRHGHSRLKVIDGRLFCTTCEQWVEEAKDE